MRISSFRAACNLSIIATACAMAMVVNAFADNAPAPVASSDVCPLLTKPYTAAYHGSYKGWRIDTLQQLEKRANGQWHLAIQIDNFLGSILETTYFTVTTDGHIRSEEYSYRKKVLMNRSDTGIAFDWISHLATITGGKANSVPLSGGELDDLDYQLALRCDLLAGMTDMHYPVVDGNGLDTLEFKVVGEEELDTHFGKLNTLVVKRIRTNSNRSTTLWFSKDLDYTMVKLLQEEKKDAEAYLLYLDDLQPLPRR